MNVAIVTTFGTPCGVAEHSAYLIEAVEGADRTIQHHVVTDLHPQGILGSAEHFDLLVLNYHAQLHSQWHPEHIREVQARGGKVLAIYHDTGVPNTDQCKGICAAANAAVVHEPCEDLEGNVHYIRQGIPGWAVPAEYWRTLPGWGGQLPIVGTVGFPFPWKNYDLLCEASALAGWATLILAPGATTEQIAGWKKRQPHLKVVPEFVSPHQAVVAALSGCDATAFLYSCANGGTSAAIRQGIAARKPVLASHPSVCRQNRDLLGEPAIEWLTDLSPQGVALRLSGVAIQRVDAGIVALAERDSWAKAGQRYAQLYHQLVGA